MRLKNVLIAIAFTFVVISCGKKSEESVSEKVQEQSSSSVQWQGYDRVEASELPDNVIKLIAEEWMLITAGSKDSFNTMTANWGGMGFLWGKPTSFAFVRETRHTYQFLQREEGFTLSFFTEDYRDALKICGSKSGRDSDKVKEAGLTPVETPLGYMSFAEARMIIECNKMFVQEVDYNNLTEGYKLQVMKSAYTKDASKHYLFASDMVNVWIKR